MRELNIGSLGGLHYELYDLSPGRRKVNALLHVSGSDVPAFLDLNGFFWSEFLSEDNIRGLIRQMRDTLSDYSDVPMAFRAAVAAPDAFVRRVRDAEHNIFEQNLPERTFFSHLETLSNLCRIHSALRGNGFELTIHEGYLLDALSSVRLIRDCLSEGRNPYLPFLRKYAWPAIQDFRPECVWINGRLTLANMAVACYTRKTFPETKIFWAGEGSEYYASILTNDKVFLSRRNNKGIWA